MKYVITAPYAKDFPIEVEATSRIEALANAGFVVWTDEEYNKSRVGYWPYGDWSNL